MGLSGTCGFANNLLEKISLMIWTAWPILADRKNIQANTVKENVSAMWNNSLNEGRSLPAATVSKLFLLVLKMMEGIINRAFNAPQIINVQFAPCQNPLTTKMINVFLILIHKPPLLPPKGIYK